MLLFVANAATIARFASKNPHPARHWNQLHARCPAVRCAVNILGISAYYHDSAACLVRDGEIAAAAQEERFTRVKHDAAFPRMAVAYCLQEAGLKNAAHVDLVAFYERPFLKFDRLLSTYLAIAPKGFRSFLSSMSIWMEQKIWTKDILRNELNYEGTIVFADHHESHAASAFFPSPFDDAAILAIDGVGGVRDHDHRSWPR